MAVDLDSKLCGLNNTAPITWSSKQHYIGLGHDDEGIDAFGPHFDKLKAMTAEGRIGSADASGWDLSVSADSLWQVNGQ